MCVSARRAARGAVRAVPALVATLIELASRHHEVVYIGDPDGLLGERGRRYRQALVKIGKPATLELLKAIRNDSASISVSIILSLTLIEIHDGWAEAAPQTNPDGRHEEDHPTSLEILLLRQLRDAPLLLA